MKRLWLLSFTGGLLFAQTAHNVEFDRLETEVFTSELEMELSRVKGMTYVDEKKIIDYYVVNYNPPPIKFPPLPDATPGLVGAVQTAPAPVALGSATFPYTANVPLVTPFYNQFPGGQVQYTPLLRSGSAAVAHPGLTTVQPAPPTHPRAIFLDGAGNSIVAFDMLTFSVVSQVVVPSTTGPFGIRPTFTSSSQEVWVANGAIQVSVVDLVAQNLVANIPTPSIPAGATAGIVFTPDGTTAFEAVKFFNGDSAGNLGALLVFDAVNRKVSSTLLLKSAPTALLMAPDGLTVYFLSDTGTVTYYDVLSGTDDLTLSTFTPGVGGGYGSFDQIFIHPDGTRLFWSYGVNLVVFDLLTHKIVNQFSSGLPTTSGTTMSMSQDGGRVYFSNGQADVVVMDTLYGHILAAYNTGTPVSVFGGPPLAP